MTNSSLIGETGQVLGHSGIPNMHWGVRRYQNYDGTLTEAGKLRYRKGNGTQKKSPLAAMQQRRAAAKRAAEKKKAAEEKREAAKKEELSAEVIKAKKELILQSRDPKLLYENAHLFNNKELGDAYLRLNTEKSIKALIPKEVSRGQKFIDSYLKVGKTVNEVLDVSVKIGENLQKTGKLLSGNKKK